jgi:hypothetical protein
MEKAETARGYRVGIMREKGVGRYGRVQIATSTIYLASLVVKGVEVAT